MPKKDLARMAMTYGYVYVASVAMGAKDEHTLRAFLEAEAYDGPSLIIAYSHCIAHGINMITGLQHQKAAVNSGYWPLFRYNPDLVKENKNPFQLDSAAPKGALQDFLEWKTVLRCSVKAIHRPVSNCRPWRKQTSMNAGRSIAPWLPKARRRRSK